MRAILLPSIFITLAACANTNGAPSAQTAAIVAEPTPAERGLAFAQKNCSSCHAVTTGSSPNANAPVFVDVINDPDLNEKTLTNWLRNSHNFPVMMNFKILPDHIDDLAAHMLTLKDPAYKPRI